MGELRYTGARVDEASTFLVGLSTDGLTDLVDLGPARRASRVDVLRAITVE